MTLTADQFTDFYKAVNGYPPFPWQKRLVKEIDAAEGLWPAVLDLPTSSGKTSALDVAVFLLAMQASKSVHDRTAAIRTFFVVDRRIVVDEAADKARRLAEILNADKIDEPVVKEVADRLRKYGGTKALHVSVLRGGMYRDGSWAESPTQPTICLSTVDQVGSRLLFRGYGVSPYQRAVHAGLVGNDALILVDEAHLSRPFLETLKAVEFYRSELWAECPVKTPFQVVVMSATAGNAVEPVVKPPDWKVEAFQLEQDDRDDAILKQRLGASKQAELKDVKGGSDDEDSNRNEFAEAIAKFAEELAKPPVPPPAPKKQPNRRAAPTVDLTQRSLFTPEATFAPPQVQVIGIVVNRVDTARRVYDLLAPKGAETPDYDVILLTGRIRPYDRDRLLCEWFEYMEAKKDRPAPKKGKLYLVATQTVEVGANLSFDALVTEAAPIDALRQRFGRLDRLGLRGISHAVIATRKDLLRKDDPVYGSKIKKTWDWLGDHLTKSGKVKTIDFGIDAMARFDRTELDGLSASSDCAPVMMPAHVDDWVQTSVAPVPDPDPALFLHGPKSGPADVSVVWRADVTRELLEDRKNSELPQKIVALVPPTSMEALSLPVWHVQDWFRSRDKAIADITDLEGEPDPNPNRKQDERTSYPFLVWKGPAKDDGTKVSHNLGDIYPGCTIIVPSNYGGCDEFGWKPDHTGDVTDIADDCSWRAKRRPVLRVNDIGNHRKYLIGDEIHPAIWARYLDESLRREIVNLLDDILSDSETPKWKSLGRLRDRLPETFTWLIPRKTKPPVRYPGRDERGWVIVGPARVKHPDDSNAEDAGDEAPADDDGTSFIGADGYVHLDMHCRGVQAKIDQFTQSLTLEEGLREIVSRAALLHDPGKADPRFQIWLYGSEALAAKNRFQLIAKSMTEARNPAAIEAARKRAGWPKGGRHEAGSVHLARSDPAAFAGLRDPELCEFMLGTHHGRGRPLWPFTKDDESYDVPGTVVFALDGFSMSANLPARPEDSLAALHTGWVDLFWRLVRRYGYWGLAYLETLLVLADHRQSEAEREETR